MPFVVLCRCRKCFPIPSKIIHATRVCCNLTVKLFHHFNKTHKRCRKRGRGMLPRMRTTQIQLKSCTVAEIGLTPEFLNVGRYNYPRKHCRPRYEAPTASISGPGTVNEAGSSRYVLPEAFSSLFCSWQTAEPADKTSLPQVISICLWQTPAVIFYLIHQRQRDYCDFQYVRVETAVPFISLYCCTLKLRKKYSGFQTCKR